MGDVIHPYDDEWCRQQLLYYPNSHGYLIATPWITTPGTQLVSIYKVRKDELLEFAGADVCNQTDESWLCAWDVEPGTQLFLKTINLSSFHVPRVNTTIFERFVAQTHLISPPLTFSL